MRMTGQPLLLRLQWQNLTAEEPGFEPGQCKNDEEKNGAEKVPPVPMPLPMKANTVYVIWVIFSP